MWQHAADKYRGGGRSRGGREGGGGGAEGTWAAKSALSVWRASDSSTAHDWRFGSRPAAGMSCSR